MVSLTSILAYPLAKDLFYFCILVLKLIPVYWEHSFTISLCIFTIDALNCVKANIIYNSEAYLVFASFFAMRVFISCGTH